MSSCEMCGKNTEDLVSVKIEKTSMKVCKNCSKYGERESNNQTNAWKTRQKFNREANEERLVPNYSQLIKASREKMGLKQEDVAKKLNEKESVIHQTESGHLRPRTITIKKFEKLFGIKLMEKVQPIEYEKKKESSANLTFGDILKNAMKKS